MHLHSGVAGGVCFVAGGVNACGRDDVLMGCRNTDDGAVDTGSVILFTRNAANNGFDTGVELDNNFALLDDRCGTGVTVGDVNADGI